ncbi:hypothetical protein [Pseudomonas citronellolis]|uniref:hypothetical protein n=1 Tax=Pseudomonas citronellolis TaxID=53408 RepID=UPI003A4C67FA
MLRQLRRDLQHDPGAAGARRRRHPAVPRAGAPGRPGAALELLQVRGGPPGQGGSAVPQPDQAG